MGRRQIFSRRTFIKQGATVTAGLAAATVLGRSAFGQNPPIRIGHQCDLTGALASTGYWRKKATDAAATWLNANGGIAGRQVEVVTINTESKVDVGVLRLRHLIQDQKVDFVIGSQHGGIAIASNPVAQSLKTLYVSMSRTDNVTENAANPYVFRLMVTTSLAAQAAGGWMTEQVAKTWGILFADYVWGKSHRDAWDKRVAESGGKVIQSQPMPVNTADPLPYVATLNRSAEAMFIALLAPDIPRAIPALNQMGFSDKKLVTADALFGVFDILSLGAQANGLWGMDSVSWELADQDTPAMRNMRKAVGVDEHGREVGSKDFCMMGDIWPAWENLGFLKQNIEGSRWKSKADTPALIKFAEAHPNYAEGPLFPQGSLFVRPEDHQAFCDYLVLRIEGGRIRVKQRVPKEKGIYPAKVNLTKS